MSDALTDNVLVLVRHGESEWNRLNLFTGWRNPDLTDKGVIEARVAGRMIRDHRIKFDIAFTSVLKRAQHTLDIMLDEMNQPNVPIVRDAALNERDYGELSGLNKDEARKKWGESQVMQWRRSFDKREFATGAPILFRLGADGRSIDRKDLLPARSLAAPPEDRVV